ncbi:MAG: hypothetical protein WKF81_03260 [Thermomicrobiales bacterium]
MPLFSRKQRTNDADDSYLWCDTCRRSYRHDEVTDGACPVCASPTRIMGKYSAIVRGLMSNELSASPLETKYRQIIRLIWASNGMGERYYRIIAPDMPYNKFEARVTELLCRGAEEGWVRFVLPPAPLSDESAYRLEFDDDDHFLNELEDTFAQPVAAGTSDS